MFIHRRWDVNDITWNQNNGAIEMVYGSRAGRSSGEVIRAIGHWRRTLSPAVGPDRPPMMPRPPMMTRPPTAIGQWQTGKPLHGIEFEGVVQNPHRIRHAVRGDDAGQPDLARRDELDVDPGVEE